MVMGAFYRRQELDQVNFTIKQILTLIYSVTVSFLFMKPDIFIFYLEIISPKLGSDASSPFWIMSKKKQ